MCEKSLGPSSSLNKMAAAAAAAATAGTGAGPIQGPTAVSLANLFFDDLGDNIYWSY